MDADGVSAELIAEIYEAAAEEAGWQRFAQAVSHATQVPGVGVWIVENDAVTDISLFGAMDYAGAPYQEHYYKQDIWQRDAMRMPRDHVFLASEGTSEEELLASEFYNDFLRQFGVLRPLGVTTQLAPGVVATLAGDKPWTKHLFEESDKKHFQKVFPYVKSALQLRRRLQRARDEAGTWARVIEALNFGVVVCDETGRVVFANAEAEALAAQGIGIVLRSVHGRVRAARGDQAQALATLIRDAATGGAGGPLRLSDPRSSETVFALVTHLPRTYAPNGEPGRALLALRRASGPDPALSREVLGKLFRLSPTQAMLSIALQNGQSLEEVAAERGVKITTLRTHLAEIFLRTGAESQRDLIRLLGRLPPLRG